jgi:hypothetical protein
MDEKADSNDLDYRKAWHYDKKHGYVTLSVKQQKLVGSFIFSLNSEDRVYIAFAGQCEARSGTCN